MDNESDDSSSEESSEGKNSDSDDSSSGESDDMDNVYSNSTIFLVSGAAGQTEYSSRMEWNGMEWSVWDGAEEEKESMNRLGLGHE